jgi:hypothetical protein
MIVGLTALAAVLLARPALAQAPPDGKRIFFTGHSFHFFMPPILGDIAAQAGIKDHKQVGLSAIGGSKVIQHWAVADEKNKAKEALKSGKLDVFTMAPIYLPDEGIENFVKLGIDNNPKIRLFVQENWLPWDKFDLMNRGPKDKKVDHNLPTADELRKMHAQYFKIFDELVADLNKKHETKAVRVAPIGQAVVALRIKIIEGKAPGLKEQSDLFTDGIGHAKPPLQALVAYCYYGLIYEKSPVGLPAPKVLGKASPELNRMLQEIAWEAVTSHPLSGVK